eukprot:6207397-Pleurochrysis_carterae.AAC.1
MHASDHSLRLTPLALARGHRCDCRSRASSGISCSRRPPIQNCRRRWCGKHCMERACRCGEIDRGTSHRPLSSCSPSFGVSFAISRCLLCKLFTSSTSSPSDPAHETLNEFV